ncbi:MAG: polyphosphate kinase 2 family protein [Rhizobiales bacterium]|nr:polyphosphate kinase 2 family protein [Hyphomicrobiales bacterium]
MTIDRAKMLSQYRITAPEKFRLKDMNPGDSFGLTLSKDEAKDELKDVVKEISKKQEMLFAQDQWSLLVILQAMDAAGKDSVLDKVMSGINPQGCQVTSFKAPTSTELDHDWLWRTTVALPERGRIGVFNRSYYEEVLVVRVHPEILGKQRLPKMLAGKDIWQERFDDIRGFEKHMARNGTKILKFFLNVSKEEQKKRFLDRIDEPDKNWKFNAGDVEERKLWSQYMDAYEDAIRNTSTDHAPWYVVPADKKWFTRLVVAHAMNEALEGLGLAYPKVDAAALEEMKKAREALSKEK